MLFDDPVHMPVIALPRRLDHLAGRIPAELGIDGERLLTDNTLFNYFMAFETEDRRSRVRAAMLQALPGQRPLLFSAQMMPTPVWLRFCPACNAENLAHPLRQEMYWDRRHQLPGVEVCARHSRPLRSSVVPTSWAMSGITYRPATSETCPVEAVDLFDRTDTKLLDEAVSIAVGVMQFVNQLKPVVSQADRARTYRSLLEAAGLNEKRGMRLNAAWSSLLNRWPATFRTMPHLLRTDGKPSIWLREILNPSRTLKSPILHIMMEDWLARPSTTSISAELPPASSADAGLRPKRRTGDDELAGVDMRTSGLVEVAAAAIRSRYPYERVSRSSLSRETGRSELRRKNGYMHLPMTVTTMEREVEGMETYVRRIAEAEAARLTSQGTKLNSSNLAKSLGRPRVGWQVTVFREVAEKFGSEGKQDNGTT